MKRHHWYYLFLALVFGIGMLAMSILGYSKSLQMGILVLLSIFYVVMGIIHHAIHHTITARIVIEYIAIATLGISMLLFVFQGI